MDLDVGEERSRPSSRSEGAGLTVEVAVPIREEDKEEEGTVENGNGTVESVAVV